MIKLDIPGNVFMDDGAMQQKLLLLRHPLNDPISLKYFLCLFSRL